MSLTQLRLQIERVEQRIDDPATEFYDMRQLQCKLDALLVDLKLEEQRELERLMAQRESGESRWAWQFGMPAVAQA